MSIPPFFTHQILVHFARRIGALVAAFFVIWVVTRILRHHASERALRTPACVLLVALIIQILLGAETIWSGKGVIPTTLHVAVGAFALATSLFLTLAAHRILLPQSTSRVTVASAGAAVE